MLVQSTDTTTGPGIDTVLQWGLCLALLQYCSDDFAGTVTTERVWHCHSTVVRTVSDTVTVLLSVLCLHWYCYRTAMRTWHCYSTTVRTWLCYNPAVRTVSGPVSIMQWKMCLVLLQQWRKDLIVLQYYSEDLGLLQSYSEDWVWHFINTAVRNVPGIVTVIKGGLGTVKVLQWGSGTVTLLQWEPDIVTVLQWGLCLTISVIEWGLCLVLHYRTAFRILPDSISSFAMMTLTLCLVGWYSAVCMRTCPGTCTSSVEKDSCAWYWHKYCRWPGTGVSIACVNCVLHCYRYSCKDCAENWLFQAGRVPLFLIPFNSIALGIVVKTHSLSNLLRWHVFCSYRKSATRT